MKKILLLCMVLMCFQCYAQYIDGLNDLNTMHPHAYLKAGFTISPLTTTEGGFPKGSSAGPYLLKADFNCSDNLTLGLGYYWAGHNGTDSIQDFTYDPNTYQSSIFYRKYNWSHTENGILLRMNYFVKSRGKLQAYFGLGAGMVISKYQSTLDASGTFDFNSWIYNRHIFTAEVIFGINYLWSDGFGAYLETGIGRSLISAGLVKCFGQNLK